jgi:hypothetical protein
VSNVKSYLGPSLNETNYSNVGIEHDVVSCKDQRSQSLV